MKDNEFSCAGSEFNPSGQEFEPAVREWSDRGAEIDSSGREYRQESGALPAGKKKKRRITPPMATIAAVATAVVVVSPIRFLMGNFPVRVPNADSKAYLDDTVEAVRSGDWDLLWAAATDPRLEQTVRDDLAPYAMELSEKYGLEHSACGNDGDSESWTTLEQYINATNLHVVYNGETLEPEGFRDEGENALLCNRDQEESGSGIYKTVRFSWDSPIRLNQEKDGTEARVEIHSREDSDQRNVTMTWYGGRFRVVYEGGDRDYIYLSDGERKTTHWQDNGDETEKSLAWTQQLSGQFVCRWVADASLEDGGYFIDYLENGTVTREESREDGTDFHYELEIVNGSVQRKNDGRLTVEEDAWQSGTYHLIYWYAENADEGAIAYTIETAQADSEEDFLYHLF